MNWQEAMDVVAVLRGKPSKEMECSKTRLQRVKDQFSSELASKHAPADGLPNKGVYDENNE